ncbi:MAG: leucine--tRNA ligase [Pseudomonadales bacterium]
MTAQYDPHGIETTVQQQWQDAKAFEVGSPRDADDKYYCLTMFPYPSGQLHMGHVRAYTLGDVIGRYQRLCGKDVLQPMGWDAFGLPAENAAIKNNIPPASWTMDNIANMRGQMQSLGFAFDWTREFATCDPDYYRWEQWFFIKLYQKGMVYRKSSMVNWDPVDQTVLANEQVVDGKGWRSGAPVERRELPQWFLKITDYAQELLDELDELPGWPESVKSMQRNWIGRSVGIEIDFQVPVALNGDSNAAAALTDEQRTLTVYTTRPDTLLGATYVAVAPEHPVATAAAAADPELQAFVTQCRNVKAAEADMATMEKLGQFSGLYAEHPLTGKAVPIWVANFVLMEYGSGAVMSVPGHDQRDWEFARKYGLDIVQVVEPIADINSADSNKDVLCDLTQSAYTERGRLVNSGSFDGLDFQAAFDAIADALIAKQVGRRTVNFRLRDWGVSRQRYWGCPIPMVNCDDCGVVPVSEHDLPVLLPTDVTFEGVSSPLKSMPEFLNTTCPQCGKPAVRETDTFDTFMESSWYYARFASPDANAPMLDERAKFWTPVNYYVGGIEHAILHLLYARFFHKLMRDEGLLDSNEPFENLLMLGMVLKDGKKMSKSAGDAGNPQKLLQKYGADAVRSAMMFAAPPEQSFEWSEAGVEGQSRFLKRLFGVVHEHMAEGPPPALNVAELGDDARALRRTAHSALQRAADDYGRRIAFNTVVSKVHELVNAVRGFAPASANDRAVVHEALRFTMVIFSPIAPHITQDLWQALGEPGLVVQSRWPTHDAEALVLDAMTLVVQVNGKVRAKIEVASDVDEAAAKQAALDDENVQRFMADKSLRKAIYVPGKLVNLVVG